MKRFPSASLLLGLVFLTLSMSHAVADDFSIKNVKNQRIDILYKGRPMVRLMIDNDTSSKERAHETYKVFTHIVDPLDPNARRTITKGPRHKYTHHRGVFIGWSNTKVNGVGKADTWHMENGTRQVFQKILDTKTSDTSAHLAVGINWIKGNKKLLSERRTIVVHQPSSPKRFTMDQKSTLLASEGKIVLRGDPEHAGYQFRAHQAVAKNNSAQYLYPEGVKKSDVKNAKSIPWAAQQFQIADRTYTVQHMSHPSLPDEAFYSAYRSYGRFGVFFTDTIEEGRKATYQIRLHIRGGAFPDNPRRVMKERYKKYLEKVK